jgi:uncharacterized membrane protein YqjE
MATLLKALAWYQAMMLGLGFIGVVWSLVSSRRKRPPDGHTRAEEREERWYPLK